MSLERGNTIMIDRLPMQIDPLNRRGWINVYFPEDYFSTDRRYPVLYMFDGQNLFFDQQAPFGHSWKLKEFMDLQENPCIVIGLECDSIDQNRLHEYTPYALTDTFYGPTRGLGSVLMEWIVHVLKPYVDENFRTWPQREATAIAGSSMGGLMAFFAVVRHNHVFSKAACLSPSLFICAEEISKEFEQMEMNPDTRIYWSFGTKELSPVRRVKTEILLNEYKWLLESRGGLGRVRFIANAKHNEKNWSAQNPDYYSFLWNDPNDL